MPSTEQSQTATTNNPKSNTSSPRTPRSSTNSSSGQKKRFKGKRTKSRGTTPKLLVRRAPVFEYISKCCNVPAQKPALVKSTGGKDAKPGSLGSWRCGFCKKRCKVTPRKPALFANDRNPVPLTGGVEPFVTEVPIEQATV